MGELNIIPGALRQNFRHFYADIFWFGVLLGSGMTFLAVYLSRIQATGFQIGVLTAGPALINLLLSLPVGRWLERRSLLRLTFRFSVIHRMMYVLLIPIPWMVSAPAQISTILLTSIVLSIPGTVLAIGFNSMFADLVPPEWRAEVVGRRNALLAISVAGTSLICGLLLDEILFPLNYQLVFGIGALGAMLSSYHLGRLKAINPTPPRIGQPILDYARPGVMRFIDTLRPAIGLRFLARSGGKPLLRLDLLRGSFGPFMAAFLVFYTMQYLPLPLFPLYFVNDLNLTDGAISLGSALYYLAMLLVSLLIKRVSDRYGHFFVLVSGALSYGFYPLINWLASDARLFWMASFAGGASGAIAGAGIVNRLMERVPDDDRPAHMALHNLALSIGILAGSLLGPAFASWFDLRNALLISAGLRFFAGLLLWRWG